MYKVSKKYRLIAWWDIIWFSKIDQNLHIAFFEDGKSKFEVESLLYPYQVCQNNERNVKKNNQNGFVHSFRWVKLIWCMKNVSKKFKYIGYCLFKEYIAILNFNPSWLCIKNLKYVKFSIFIISGLILRPYVHWYVKINWKVRLGIL